MTDMTVLEKAQKDGYSFKKKFGNRHTSTFVEGMLRVLKKDDCKSEVLEILLPLYSARGILVPKEFGLLDGKELKEYTYVFLTGFLGTKE